MNKMPCHITDGPSDPYDVPEYEEQDPDEAYEEQRDIDLAYQQSIIRDLRETIRDIASTSLAKRQAE